MRDPARPCRRAARCFVGAFLRQVRRLGGLRLWGQCARWPPRPVVLRSASTARWCAMTRPTILVGCWPRRMCAELSAIYCGEPSTAAFLKRVGKDYPQPRVNDGRRRLWLRDDLDKAILPPELVVAQDIAEDL